jgi:hypothetical protein
MTESGYMKNVLSLGAGVQSTAVLLMSIHGELPHLDAAFFADTGWEPKEVYAHFEWLRGVAEDAGIDVHVVSAGNIRQDTLDAIGTEHGRTTLPFFVLKQDGERGMTRRKCTHIYKVLPMEKAIREYVGLSPRQRVKCPVVRQWFGISIDEWKRMRQSPNKWSLWEYPLIDRKISRAGCSEWLRKHGYSAPRSACIGCPFHHDNEWSRVLADPDNRKDAEEFDAAIRKSPQVDGQCFLHRSCKPLGEVQFGGDPLQLPLWDDECMGMCGV